MPLNVNGRVCFPYSVCFGLAGLLVVYGIAPFTKFITGWISPIMYELFSLIFMGLVAVDTAITVSALTDFSRTIISVQNSFNNYMSEFVNEVQEKKREADEKAQERKREGLSIEERLKSGMSFEDRKRSIKASTERAIDSMGTLKKSALARAQGFRNQKIEKRYLEEFSESLKNKLSRKNKK